MRGSSIYKTSEVGQVEVRGLQGVISMLSQMSDEVQKQIYRNNMRKALKIIKSAAESNIERVTTRRTGTLAKSVKITVSARTGKDVKGTVRSVAPHAHLIEWGHRTRAHGRSYYFGKGGKIKSKATGELSRLRTAERPFMRPALIANSEKVLDILQEGIEQSLDRHFNK